MAVNAHPRLFHPALTPRFVQYTDEQPSRGLEFALPSSSAESMPLPELGIYLNSASRHYESEADSCYAASEAMSSEVSTYLGELRQVIEEIMEEEKTDPPSEASKHNALAFAEYLNTLNTYENELPTPTVCMSARGGYSFNWLLQDVFLTVQIGPQLGDSWLCYYIKGKVYQEFEINPHSFVSSSYIMQLLSA